MVNSYVELYVYVYIVMYMYVDTATTEQNDFIFDQFQFMEVQREVNAILSIWNAQEIEIRDNSVSVEQRKSDYSFYTTSKCCSPISPLCCSSVEINQRPNEVSELGSRYREDVKNILQPHLHDWKNKLIFVESAFEKMIDLLEKNMLIMCQKIEKYFDEHVDPLHKRKKKLVQCLNASSEILRNQLQQNHDILTTKVFLIYEKILYISNIMLTTNDLYLCYHISSLRYCMNFFLSGPWSDIFSALDSFNENNIIVWEPNNETNDSRNYNMLSDIFNIKIFQKRLNMIEMVLRAYCGEADCLNRLGILYAREKRDQTAFHLFLIAAIQGNINAQMNLAKCFQHGRGTEVDLIRHRFLVQLIKNSQSILQESLPSSKRSSRRQQKDASPSNCDTDESISIMDGIVTDTPITLGPAQEGKREAREAIAGAGAGAGTKKKEKMTTSVNLINNKGSKKKAKRFKAKEAKANQSHSSSSNISPPVALLDKEPKIHFSSSTPQCESVNSSCIGNATYWIEEEENYDDSFIHDDFSKEEGDNDDDADCDQSVPEITPLFTAGEKVRVSNGFSAVVKEIDKRGNYAIQYCIDGVVEENVNPKHLKKLKIRSKKVDKLLETKYCYQIIDDDLDRINYFKDEKVYASSSSKRLRVQLKPIDV